MVGPDESSWKEPRVAFGALDTAVDARRQIGIEPVEVLLLPSLGRSVELPQVGVVDQHIQVVL